MRIYERVQPILGLVNDVCNDTIEYENIVECNHKDFLLEQKCYDDNNKVLDKESNGDRISVEIEDLIDIDPDNTQSIGSEESDCEHEYIVDLIDIDPDNAQSIEYCIKCYNVKDD
jgi:hypothetical protein